MKNESPFLDIKSFIAEEVITEERESALPGRSPFLSLYESEDGLSDPQTEAYVTFLNQLYDEEFEVALSGLVDEATEIYEAHFGHQFEDPRTVGYQAERLLNQHFAPLVAESEALFDFLARELNQRDSNSLTEAEIDSLFERYQPSNPLTPRFEQFFGKWVKKAVNVVKKGVDLAKKGVSAAISLGLGPILSRIFKHLKSVFWPFLQKIIKKVEGRFPAELQPAIQKLKEKLNLKELEESDDLMTESAQGWELSELQHEFNIEVANLLFAQSEVEQDLEIAKALNEQGVGDSYPIAELEMARERFIEGLMNLKEGEDPAPHIQNFIPALIPLLKVAMKLSGGRPKLVNRVSPVVGRLIEPVVGPTYAPALSKAIVDLGLRFFNLEAPEESEARVAASAIASTVEETVRRAAALPDYVVDHQELFEAFVLEAFEQAAAANLPPILPEETYKKRPELTESRKLSGIWLMQPGTRRKRYKVFTRKFRKLVTPHNFSELETQDGSPLANFLEEQLGMAPGEEAEAIVHLYEAIPGTSLSDIVRHETHIPKFNGTDAQEHLHPLTREAAAMLVGEPALGRDMMQSSTSDPRVGERYFYLEIPSKRPLTVPAAKGKTTVRRKTKTRLVLDFPKNEARVYLFLSEIRAQEMAVKLRQHAHVGTIVARLRTPIQNGMNKAFSGHPKRLKIIHEAVVPGKWGEALKRLPSVFQQGFRGALMESTMKGLADHLKQYVEEFKKAAEDTADGVTVLIRVENPPGFAELRQALKAKGVSPNSLKLPEGSPTVKLTITPGYKHE